MWLHECWIKRRIVCLSMLAILSLLQPECCFTFFAARHVGSCSTWWPPGLAGSFLPRCSPAGQSLACGYSCMWLFLLRCRDLCLASPWLSWGCCALDGSDVLRTHQSLQLGVISKLAESTHCPIIWIVNEDVEQDWTQYWPVGRTACHWPPARPCDTNHQPLDTDVQTVFGSPHCLLIQPEHQLLLCEDFMEHSTVSLPRQYTLLSPCSSIQWYEIYLFFLKLELKYMFLSCFQLFVGYFYPT